jgi:hypothetical protein
MIVRAVVPIPRHVSGLVVLVALALAPPFLACGSSTVTSGVAIGKIGHGLSASAQTVPQGAEVCVLQDALATPAPGTAEKPAAETCAKAIKSDQLWRGAMVVLAAHADRLGALGGGTKPETAGQLEAALTRVRGSDWAEPSDPQEQAARDAVTQLANQMSAGDSKADLAKAIKDAAPPVKTVCDGLTSYLDKQVQGVIDIETEVEKRRTSHVSRRCGKVGDQGVCVSDSFLDRITYANVYGRAAAVADSHAETRDTLAAFCAAHQKLAEAAAKGQIDKDQTYLDVVAAVKAAPSSQRPSSQPPFSSASAKSRASAAPPVSQPPAASAKSSAPAPADKK